MQTILRIIPIRDNIRGMEGTLLEQMVAMHDPYRLWNQKPIRTISLLWDLNLQPFFCYGRSTISQRKFVSHWEATLGKVPKKDRLQPFQGHWQSKEVCWYRNGFKRIEFNEWDLLFWTKLLVLRSEHSGTSKIPLIFSALPGARLPLKVSSDWKIWIWRGVKDGIWVTTVPEGRGGGIKFDQLLH